MAYYNFILPYKKGDCLAERLIPHLLSQRTKQKKPNIFFLGGDSGEGKSMTTLRLLELTAKNIGEDINLEKQIIYTPYEYPEKLKWILFNKEAKKKRIIVLMEARELVKSKLWYTVVNQAISDVNAMSRTIKPLILIVVSQDLGDVDKDIRKTINFYGYCLRPVDEKTRLYFYQVIKTRFNIQNPKMYLKKIRGLLKTEDGNKKVEIKRFIMNLPNPETRKKFEELDFKAKSEIVLKKLDNLAKVLELEKPKLGRIEKLVEVVAGDSGLLNMLIRRTGKGNLRVRKEFKTIYDMTGDDVKEFEKMLTVKLTESGLMGDKIESREPAIQ